MKYFLLTATLLALTACCGCMDKPKMAAANTEMATKSNLSCSTAKVSGMTCEACAATISENLKKVSGVKDTQIDVKSGTVKIFSDKKSVISSKEVKSIIEKSGYEFKSLTPNCK